MMMMMMMIFIYCNWVSSRCQWSVNWYKNRTETKQKEKQCTKRYKTQKTRIQIKKHKKKIKKHKSSILYVFFWVIPRRLNFICRRFRTLRLFHLNRRVGIRLWRWDSVPKRRHIKFRRRGITQKKAYNLLDTFSWHFIIGIFTKIDKEIQVWLYQTEVADILTDFFQQDHMDRTV